MLSRIRLSWFQWCCGGSLKTSLFTMKTWMVCTWLSLLSSYRCIYVFGNFIMGENIWMFPTLWIWLILMMLWTGFSSEKLDSPYLWFPNYQKMRRHNSLMCGWALSCVWHILEPLQCYILFLRHFSIYETLCSLLTCIWFCSGDRRRLLLRGLTESLPEIFPLLYTVRLSPVPHNRLIIL